MRRSIVSIGALSALIATRSAAQAAELPRALVVTAENVTALASPVPRAGDARLLRPGDVVRYRLTFTNHNADSVRRVQFSDHIPSGLRYVPGSASADRPDVQVEFSVDGGRTFSPTPEIEAAEDGKKVRRPAPPESFTDVRWTGAGWVKSRAQLTAEFRLVLPVGSVVGSTK